ncbi:hypothetical protein EF808_02960 [archaeon]|nr:MAG: hypothetical protein EF808_02960 [archaeon]
MKKTLAIAIITMMALTLCKGAVISDVQCDEEYNNHSNEISPGPGDPPEDGMSREEPRTRNKDS